MLLLFTSQEAYYLINPNAESKSHYPSEMKWLFGMMAFTLLVEVVLGTEIRGGLEMIRKENPMVESQFLIDMLGPFKYAHSILGFLIAILSGFIWYGLVKKSLNPSNQTKVKIKITSLSSNRPTRSNPNISYRASYRGRK